MAPRPPAAAAPRPGPAPQSCAFPLILPILAALALAALAAYSLRTSPSTSGILVSRPGDVAEAVDDAATLPDRPVRLPPGFVPPVAPLRIRPTATVGFGVMCGLKYLAAWRALFAALPPEARRTVSVVVYFHGSDTDTRAAEAIMHEWGSAADSDLALVSTPVTRNHSADTWTSGRNDMTRALYAYEVARGRQFGWWGFADGDMGNIQCNGCAKGAPDAVRSSCCFMRFVNATQASPFAIVANLGYGFHDSSSDSLQVFMAPAEGSHPNLDAQLNLLDRRAAPVLFPYYEGFDKTSMWGSAYILNWHSCVCLFGAFTVTAIKVHPFPDERHEAVYPRQPVKEEEIEAAVRKLSPPMAERFYDARRAASKPPRQYWKPPFHDINVARDSKVIPAWRESDDFKFCLTHRAPDFVAKVGLGVPEAPR